MSLFVPLKLAPGRRKRCASLVADEQCAAQLIFKGVNARADRRLADVEAIRGTDEISGCNNGEKGSGQLGVHGLRPFFVSMKRIKRRSVFRLSKVIYDMASYHIVSTASDGVANPRAASIWKVGA